MNCIVVVDNEWGIGKKNDLLFRLPLDLKENFKTKTLNKVVLMGANTFYSLKRGALPDRINVVVDNSGTKHDGTVSVSSLDEAFEAVKNYDTDDVFVIGGASIYKQLLPYCNKAYVTKVNAVGGAEVFFPNLDEMPEWKLANASEVVIDNGYETTYCVYEK